MAAASSVVSTRFHLCSDISGLISPNQIAAINTSGHTGGMWHTHNTQHTHWSKYVHIYLHIDPKALHLNLIYWTTELKKREWPCVCACLCWRPTFCKLGLVDRRVWLIVIIVVVSRLLLDEEERKYSVWSSSSELILSVNQLTRQMELKMQPALLHVDTMFSHCVPTFWKENNQSSWLCVFREDLHGVNDSSLCNITSPAAFQWKLWI